MVTLNDYLDKLDDSERKKLHDIRKGLKFCDYLKSNNIKYDVVIKHKEVLGCDESYLYYKRFYDYLEFDFSICKNLLLKERKGEQRYYLVITDSNKQVDISSLKDTLNCKKLEFVDVDHMKDVLNTTPGNVSLFNIIYDKNKKVNLVIDKDLFEYNALAFHPLYNGMSLFIKPSECLKFIKIIDRDVNIVSIFEKSSYKVLEKTIV